jgi:hypothetical protein
MAKQNTPGRERMGTDIPQFQIQRVGASLGTRIAEAARYAISGITPQSWFGPGQPLAPMAQDQSKDRQHDYPVGYNTQISPRAYESVSFHQLRGMADAFDLLRVLIETRKDQVEAFEWEFGPADETKAADPAMQAKCDNLKAFFLQPTPEYDWHNWIRMVMEDLLVIDAVAIYPRYNRGGGIFSLDLIDAATITRKIGIDGRTPMPPDVAYVQVLHGQGANDLTSEELVYKMRNPRTNRIYGMSPVEQVIMTVNIALRKQVSTLQYFTEGNVPEAIAGLPLDWNIDQVKEFQLWWDSIMEGNTAQRRHMKFVPWDPSKIHLLRPPDLKDVLDEWLCRVLCFAFSISPSAFVKDTNRATAETLRDAAKSEGVLPLLLWIQRLVNSILVKYFGETDVQFKWRLQTNIDAKDQATINDLYVKDGVLSIDEVRETIGRSPIGIGNQIITATGPVAPDYKVVLQQQQDAAQQAQELAQANTASQQQHETNLATLAVKAKATPTSASKDEVGDLLKEIASRPVEVKVDIGETRVTSHIHTRDGEVVSKVHKEAV